jgi:hypothetical protein
MDSDFLRFRGSFDGFGMGFIRALHLFSEPILYTLASSIRKLLKLDEATTNLTRPGVAKLYDEIDLLKPFVKLIWIHIETEVFYQRVDYEDLLLVCSACH